jgi:hypothetical protein
MPYSQQQNRLFQAAAHDPAVAKRVGISVADAKRMASEGVKNKPQQLAAALMRGSS